MHQPSVVAPCYPHISGFPTHLWVQHGQAGQCAWSPGALRHAGFCPCRAHLGAAPLCGSAHSPPSPARSCQRLSSAYRVQRRARLDSIKNGFCWEPVSIFIGVYPAALEPLQLSEAVAVRTLLETLALPRAMSPASQVHLCNSSCPRSSCSTGIAVEGEPGASVLFPSHCRGGAGLGMRSAT